MAWESLNTPRASARGSYLADWSYEGATRPLPLRLRACAPDGDRRPADAVRGPRRALGRDADRVVLHDPCSSRRCALHRNVGGDPRAGGGVLTRTPAGP